MNEEMSDKAFPRLLILGSMDEFVDLVRRARARGIYTVVCDGREQGPAKALASASYLIDVRDIDALTEVCRQERIDVILTAFSDVLFESSCRLAHACGLPATCSLNSLTYLRDKSFMKEMLAHLGINSSRSIIVGSDSFDGGDVQSGETSQQDSKGSFVQMNALRGHALDLTFPCVIKPLDGYGSRGVFVVQDIEDVYRRIKESKTMAQRDCSFVLEEYHPGFEFNMTNWVCEGVVYTIGIADREKSSEVPGEVPHVSRIVYPSRLFDEVYAEAHDIAQRVADYLRIKEGPLSVQFFWSPDTGVSVCEVAGRLFGYEHELVELSSGLSLEDVLLDSVCDHAQLKHRLTSHDPSLALSYCCGLYFHAHVGVLGDTSLALSVLQSGISSAVEVAEVLVYYKEGQRTGHGAGMPPYLARVFLKAQTREALDEESQRLFREFKVFDNAGSMMAYPNVVPTYGVSSLEELRRP